MPIFIKCLFLFYFIQKTDREVLVTSDAISRNNSFLQLLFISKSKEITWGSMFLGGAKSVDDLILHLNIF